MEQFCWVPTTGLLVPEVEPVCGTLPELVEPLVPLLVLLLVPLLPPVAGIPCNETVWFGCKRRKALYLTNSRRAPFGSFWTAHWPL